MLYLFLAKRVNAISYILKNFCLYQKFHNYCLSLSLSFALSLLLSLSLSLLLYRSLALFLSLAFAFSCSLSLSLSLSRMQFSTEWDAVPDAKPKVKKRDSNTDVNMGAVLDDWPEEFESACFLNKSATDIIINSGKHPVRKIRKHGLTSMYGFIDYIFYNLFSILTFIPIPTRPRPFPPAPTLPTI